MRQYDLINNIYVHPGNRTFGYSDGDAAEDYLYARIREAADVSTGSAGLAAAIRDWPSMYHLSPRRADLLRPLESLLRGELSGNSLGSESPAHPLKVLEIGSGCGAITRFLGELGCTVTALEGSERRALITRERCRDLTNVQVVCDNFSDFEWTEKFDIVLLVGVLEYSHQFMSSPDDGHPSKNRSLSSPDKPHPPLDMLRRAKSYLRPGGHLILAIENKLGLKYWAGAPEDHTGRPFDGIEDRYTSDTAVTFGREELIRLLADAGFPSNEFLYPFPDYKLPEVIVKNSAFQTGDLDLDTLLFEKFDYPHASGQATEFSPTRAAGSVIENSLMPDMANSFLIISGNNPLPSDNTLVYTYNSVRQKAYCKSNLFVQGSSGDGTSTPGGRIRVIRHKLYPEAPLPADHPITHRIPNEDYTPGRLLSTYAHDIVTRPGWTLPELGAWAERYYQILLDHSIEQTPSSTEPSRSLTGHHLDLTPFNIIITPEDQPIVFDQEWESPDPVPLYFIFFRGLVYSLDKLSRYAPPADGTPTDLIPLATALAGMFIPFDTAQLEDCIRLEEKYFHAVPLTPGKPFVHGGIPLHHTLSHQLEQTRAQLAEAQALLEAALRDQATIRTQSHQQMARIHQDHQSHITLLHQHIDWYRHTYEQRSLPGLLLQHRLSKAQAQQKYLTAFLIASMQEKGVGATLSLIIKTLSAKGINGWLHPRKALLPLMRTPAAPVLSANATIREAEDPAAAMADIQAFTWLPKISLIMPVYNTDPRWLQTAVDSIRQQWYDNWELCIADDGSTHRGTQQALRQLQELADPRITIVRLEKNAGISEASNAAIAIAEGYFIALMDHDDEITPDALYQVVKDLNIHGDADILYTDECKVDEEGQLSDPFYKPAYSDELLLNMMYPGHLTVYKKDFLLKKVASSAGEYPARPAGPFRKAYDLSQDYDLMLRAVEQTTRIRHIEKVVYHWRMTAGSSSQGDKPHARITNLAALRDAMSRRNIPAKVIELPAANRVRLRIDQRPLVSIIIPTDSRSNLKDTLESIYLRTGYTNFEVVVVTNSKLIASAPGIPSAAQDSYSEGPLRYIPYDKPYNFSDKCNQGALHARGEILVFFNDDVRPLQGDWLENTIEYLFLPGVGGVSPKLIYEDDSIQYAGMASGVRGLTGTTFHGYAKDSTAYINFPQSVRNVSILSGACLAIRKDTFLHVGGFDSVNTPSSHSDVDLSFKLLDAGLRCVYTPYATLRHIGHLSLKEYDESPAGKAKDKADIFLLRRWTQRVAEDPYFTTAMRDYLYHDSPEPYRIYAPQQTDLNSKTGAINSRPVPPPGHDVLLVSHDLSLSGAPVMLLQLCRLLIRNGYFVTVICEKEGPTAKMFLQAGAPVIIDSLLLRQHDSLTRFARNFDHVICNTVVTWPVVQQLSPLVHTIWWLHEAKIIETFSEDPGFVDTLAKARDIIAPSEYSLNYIRRYNARAEKIYYGYPEMPGPSDLETSDNETIPADNRKLIFSLIGSIEPRKGQDILVNALQQLDSAVRDRIEIWLAGRPHDPTYYQELLQTIGHASGVKIIGECDHQQCLDLMAASDVIVCPSRDDPFPVVVVEALCLSKPCIVSSHTGFAELITDGTNGFVIPNEDSKALALKLADIVQHQDDLPRIRRGARQLYKRHLILEGFEKKFLTLLRTQQPAVTRQTQIQKELLCQD